LAPTGPGPESGCFESRREVVAGAGFDTYLMRIARKK
jgi:hypothetical protein